MDLNSRAQLILTLAGVASVLGAWWKWGQPRLRSGWRLLYAALVSLGGREEIEDAATGRTLPAIPPLHVWRASIDKALDTQAEALNRLATVQVSQIEQSKLLGEMHRVQIDHEARIGSLEDVEAERAQVRDESTAMWRAIAEKDTFEGETQ